MKSIEVVSRYTTENHTQAVPDQPPQMSVIEEDHYLNRIRQRGPCDAVGQLTEVNFSSAAGRAVNVL